MALRMPFNLHAFTALECKLKQIIKQQGWGP